MRGTWKVSGFGILPLAVLALSAAAGLEAAAWLLARFWWILGTLAAVWTLAAFLAPKIARRVDRRSAVAWTRETGAAGLFMSPPRQVAAPAPAQVIIGGIHYHLTAAGTPVPADRMLPVRAIPGTAGDAITEGNPRP